MNKESTKKNKYSRKEISEILEKSFGILKGKLKMSPVAYQKKIRQEWERKSLKK